MTYTSLGFKNETRHNKVRQIGFAGPGDGATEQGGTRLPVVVFSLIRLLPDRGMLERPINLRYPSRHLPGA